MAVHGRTRATDVPIDPRVLPDPAPERDTTVSKRTFQPNNRRRAKTHGFRLRCAPRRPRHPGRPPPQGPRRAVRLRSRRCFRRDTACVSERTSRRCSGARVGHARGRACSWCTHTEPIRVRVSPAGRCRVQPSVVLSSATAPNVVCGDRPGRPASLPPGVDLVSANPAAAGHRSPSCSKRSVVVAQGDPSAGGQRMTWQKASRCPSSGSSGSTS